MGYFEFPHTRTYDSDLGWLIWAMKKLIRDWEDFSETNSIKFADPLTWTIDRNYEPSTIVIDDDGNGYISRKAVPTGVPLSNNEYWTQIFDLSDITDTIRKNIAFNNESNGTALEALRKDQLVWWNGELYIVLYDIAAGTALLIGTNIAPYTVDHKIDDVINALAQEVQDRINGDQTLQNNLNNEITDRQNADTTLQNNINDEINNRIAADNDEINNRIAADNALNTRIDNEGFCFSVKAYGAKGDGVTNDESAFRNARNACDAAGGVLYVPPGNYYLPRTFYVGSDIDVIDSGTYVNKKVVQSRKLKPSTFKGTDIFVDVKDVYGTNATTAIQAMCYDSLRDRFVLGFSDDNNGTPQIVAVTADFKQVLTGPITGAYGHINDLAYDSKRDVIYCATSDIGPNANKILILNAATLTITGNWPLSSPCYQVSYDPENDIIFYISAGSVHFSQAEDLTGTRSITYQDPNTLGIPGNWTGQGSFVYDEQFFMIYSSTYKMLLVQYDYMTGNLLNYYTRDWDFDEVEAIAIKDNIAYAISGQTALIITSFMLENSDSYDFGVYAAGGENIPDNSDLHDYMTKPGKYWVSSATHAATLTNMPDGYNEGAFTLIVTRTAFYRCRCILITNDVRTFYTANVSLPNTFGSWYRLRFEPSNDTLISVNAISGGFFAGNGLNFNFFIPTAFTPNREATITAGTVNSIRTPGGQVASNVDVTDTSKVSAYHLIATENGYRVTMTFTSAVIGDTTKTSNYPLGIQYSFTIKK